MPTADQSDPLEVKLGVCDIFVTPQGEAEENLGYTIGGASVIYSPEFQKTKVDQVTGPVEAFLIGEELGAKVPLAQNVLNKIKYAFTHGTLSGDENYLTFGSKTGKRSSTHAVLLRLHPIANAVDNYEDDVYIWKAYSESEVEIGYKNDGEQIIETMFKGLSDPDRADGNMLGMIGDSGQA